MNDSSRAAAEIARRLGDPVRRARAALAFGRVLALAVVDAELVGLLEEALSALPASDDPMFRLPALASSFVAALELARRGRLDLRQDETFAPIHLKNA